MRIRSGYKRVSFIGHCGCTRGVLVGPGKRPDDRMLWESKIELGEKFFAEIIQHPVPLDMNILKALKRCSLGLDYVPLAQLPDFYN